MASKGKAATAEKQNTKPIPKGTTRTAQIWAMVERAEGASINEIVKVTGIQPHTARAVLSIQKRKRGVMLELKEGRYRATAKS